VSLMDVHMLAGSSQQAGRVPVLPVTKAAQPPGAQSRQAAAHKEPTGAGEKLDGKSRRVVEDVEIVEDALEPPVPSKANSTNSTNSTPEGGLETVVIPHDSLLEDYRSFAREQVESADSYIVSAILPVVAASLARRVYFPWGNESIYPNLFSMLAGKAGDRKSSAINLAESLAKAVLKPEHFLAHACSAESLFDEYDSECGGSPDKILVADDANTILGTWTRSGYGERVGHSFLNLYDCKYRSESFREGGRRIIPETSTSVVFGATFDICRLQGRGISSGLQRRFLFYAAEKHGRLITCPPPLDQSGFDRLTSMLAKLNKINAVCGFSQKARAIWEEYQRKNRVLLQTEIDDAHSSRLNGAPRHVQKVAMIFQASVWVKQDGRDWDGVIHSSTLEAAIAHVDHCLQTAARLDSIAERAAITTAAEVLLAKIRCDFSTSEYLHGGWISLTKTHLTAKYASQPTRANAWKPDDLYLRIIPKLIEQGTACVADKQGKKITYRFTIED
jgi:hypothetical protein